MLSMREAKDGFRAIVAPLALVCEEVTMPQFAAWQARLQDVKEKKRKKRTCSTFMELNALDIASNSRDLLDYPRKLDKGIGEEVAVAST